MRYRRGNRFQSLATLQQCFVLVGSGWCHVAFGSFCCIDWGYAGGGGTISGIVGMGDVSPREFDALLWQILVRLVRRQ